MKDDLEDTSLQESPFFDETINFESSQKMVQLIPKPIRIMFPKLSSEKWEGKQRDVNFMYGNAEVCDNCYRYVKDITDEMSYWEENKIPDHIQGRLLNRESTIDLDSQPDLHEDSFEKFRKRMSTLKTSPERQAL